MVRIFECNIFLISKNDQNSSNTFFLLKLLIIHSLICVSFISCSSTSMVVLNDSPTYDEFKRTELSRAVIDWDETTFEKAVQKHNFWINQKDYFGMTALMYAAAHGNERFFQRLLRMGADPTIKDFTDETVMHKFSRVKMLAPVEYLTIRGVALDISNKHGMNPLHIAAIGWNVTQIQRLTDLGTNVNIQNAQLKTALHLVVEQFQAVDSLNKTLLKLADAPIKKQDRFWILSYQRLKNFGNWFRSLPDKVVQLYKPKPPILTDEKDGVKAAEILLNKQASLKLRDDLGFTVLDRVKQKKNAQLSKLFISRGLLKETDF